MQNVTVGKAELLKAMQENRANHRGVFEKAVAGYRAAAIELLDKRLTDAKAGRKIRLYFELIEPEDHTRDYDRAIRMVEMHVETVITISASDFSRFVMDDWEWRKQFSDTAKSYGVRIPGDEG